MKEATFTFTTNLSRSEEIIRLEIIGKLDYLLWDDLLNVKKIVKDYASKTLTDREKERNK